MGQYWMPVNLTKKEFVDPHKLGNGLKLWEQAASGVGTSTALILLTAAMPEARAGGDFNMKDEVAGRTIGRWAGDRIALVGDYAEDSDLPASFRASTIYDKCCGESKEVTSPFDDKLEDGTPSVASYKKAEGGYIHYVETKAPAFTDISDDVCAVIESELGGKFTGGGWREFTRNDSDSHTPCECCRDAQNRQAVCYPADNPYDR